MSNSSSSWHRFSCPKCNARCRLVTESDSPYSEWSSHSGGFGGYYLECSSCSYSQETVHDSIDMAEEAFCKDIPEDPYSEF